MALLDGVGALILVMAAGVWMMRILHRQPVETTPRPSMSEAPEVAPAKTTPETEKDKKQTLPAGFLVLAGPHTHQDQQIHR
jgi:hypothetical protein